MHSESSFNEIFMPPSGASFTHNVQGAAAMMPSDRLPNGTEDSEEMALAKASTVVIEEEASTLDIPPSKGVDHRPNYYIQGVIQGGVIYIITNLLGRESQTLFQSQRVWTIGRNREAALPLSDRALSRRHAVILYVPQAGFYLVDLNSMNGSFVNGVRIRQRQRLKDGDRLKLGSLEFSFFTSATARTISPIHPEVLTRFTSSRSRTENFIDFASLEEPDALFQSRSPTRTK
jgi:pSer/pThr/pTyr-binding forkhead associated (FHA) protein